MASKAKIQVAITATDKTKAAFNSVNKSIGNTTRAVKSLQGAIGGISGAALFRGLDAFGKQALQANRAFVEFADRIGAGAGALSELAVAGDLSGVAVNQVTLALQRSTRRIGEAAQGYGEAQRALKILGLEAKELVLLSADQQFNKLADALSGVTNQTERLTLANKLFDVEGAAVLQTLENLQRARDLARESGAVISQEEVEDLKDFRTEIAKTEAAQRSLEQAFLSTGIPRTLENIKQAALIAAEGIVDGFSVAGKFVGATFASLAAVATGEFSRVTDIFKAFNEERKDLFGDQQGAEASTPGATALSGLGKQAEKNKKTFEDMLVPLREQNEILGLQARGQEETAELLKERLRIEQQLGVSRGTLTTDEVLQLGRILETRRQITAEIERQAQAIRDAEEAERKAQRVAEEALARQKQFADQVAATMTSAFEEAIIQANSLSDIFKGLLEDLARMVVRFAILQPLAQSISGFITPFVPSFGGARASGGPVSAGKSYLVGERGPEMFTPATPGSITPGGGVDIQVINNTSSEVATETRTQTDGSQLVRFIINTVANDMSNNGVTARALGGFGSRIQPVAR